MGAGLRLGLQVSLRWVVLEHVLDLPLRFQMRAVTHRLLGMICSLLDHGCDKPVELCKIPKALGAERLLGVGSDGTREPPHDLGPIFSRTHWLALAKVLAMGSRGTESMKEGSLAVPCSLGLAAQWGRTKWAAWCEGSAPGKGLCYALAGGGHPEEPGPTEESQERESEAQPRRRVCLFTLSFVKTHPKSNGVNFRAVPGHVLLASRPGFSAVSHLLFLSPKCIYKSSGPS